MIWYFLGHVANVAIDFSKIEDPVPPVKTEQIIKTEQLHIKATRQKRRK